MMQTSTDTGAAAAVATPPTGSTQQSSEGYSPAGATAATGDVATIDANKLRALAEAADGIRDHSAFLVANPPGSSEMFEVIDDPAKANGRPVIMNLRTQDNQDPGRPRIVLKCDQQLIDDAGKVVNLADCDAIFTTLSAVEKFLVPYYSRMRDLDEVKAMRNKFATSTTSVAAFHLPTSYEGRAYLEGGVLFAELDEKTNELTLSTFSNFI
jgi:hypothetical protein